MMSYENRLRLVIANVGRDPALEVFAFVADAGAMTSGKQLSSLAPGDFAELEMTLSKEPDDLIVGRLQYTDISRAGHVTSVTLRLSPNAQPAIQHQAVTMQSPLTLGWKRVVPRRYRRHLGPATRRWRGKQAYKLP
jgi:hypothetical protein